MMSSKRKLHPPRCDAHDDFAHRRRSNVSLSEMPPQEEAHKIAELIKDLGVRSVVINMEHAAFDQGLAQQLADSLDAPCHTLADLRAETLYRTVLERIGLS